MALRARTDPFLSKRIQPALSIPPKDRVYGPGAGYVMGPFAYPSPDGTRFGPPALAGESFGVYYAAQRRSHGDSGGEAPPRRISSGRARAGAGPGFRGV